MRSNLSFPFSVIITFSGANYTKITYNVEDDFFFAAEYGQIFGQVEQLETIRVKETKHNYDVDEYLGDYSDGTNTYWFIDQK